MKAGGGEGIGKHSFSGSPHKREFPSNDDLGNFWRGIGIDPFKWLLLKFKCLSLVPLRLGICPDRELFWRLNLVSNVKFCIVFGMLPENELNDKSSTLSWGDNEAGILPERLLCCK